MALKATGDRSAWRRVDRFDGGGGWQAYPEEGLARTSHVLDTGAGAVVVDPLDVPGVDDYLAEFGDIAGVTVLQTHHTRDAVAIADRHDVPLHQPAWVSVDTGPSVEEVTHTDSLADTGFRLLETIRVPWWHEAALYDGATLVVGDVLGTAGHFRAPGEALGLHPLLRVWRPTSLAALTPDRILVGHGTGIFEDATTRLRTAFAAARRNLPGAWVNGARTVLGLR